MVSKFLNVVILVSAGTLIGRLSGFVREFVIAQRFGSDGTSDIIVLTLSLPDLLVNMLIGGALSGVFIPEFKRLNNVAGYLLYIKISIVFFCFFSLFSFVLSFYADIMVRVLAPGIIQSHLSLATGAIKLSLWSFPLAVLSGISTAYLNANGRFSASAFGTFIFNTTIIIGILSFVDHLHVNVVAFLIISGSFFRYFIQIITFPKVNASLIKHKWPAVEKELIRRYIELLISSGILFLIPVIARAFASYEDDGSISLISYAIKLIEFPIGLMSFSIILLPILSKQLTSNDDLMHARSLINISIMVILILSVPSILIFFLFANNIIHIIFGHTKINNLETLSMLSKILFFSIPFQGILTIISAILNAKRTTFPILLSNVCGCGIFTLCGLIFRPSYGLYGLACGLVLSYFFIFSFQTHSLWRLHKISIWNIIGTKDMLKNFFMMFIMFFLVFWIHTVCQGSSHINMILIAGASWFSMVGICLFFQRKNFLKIEKQYD